MPTIIEILQPRLVAGLPSEVEYATLDHANLVITLPKLDPTSHRKPVRLIFDNAIIQAVQGAHAAGNLAVEEQAAAYICNVIVRIFDQWDNGNEQVPFHVESNALD